MKYSPSNKQKAQIEELVNFVRQNPGCTHGDVYAAFCTHENNARRDSQKKGIHSRLLTIQSLGLVKQVGFQLFPGDK